MDAEANSTPMSLKWFEIWRIVILHPTVETFSRIISDPKANTKWGIIWMAIATCIAWFIGPPRMTVNLIVSRFSPQIHSDIRFVGAIVAPIVGVIVSLFVAAISHGLARLFGGAGTFRQLFYCWAVVLLPFTLLSGLAISFPSLVLTSRSLMFSTAGLIIQTISLLVCVGVNLYQFYAVVVAFSAVEKLGIWKSLVIVVLQAAVVGAAMNFLCYGLQVLMMNYVRLISVSDVLQNHISS